MVFRFQDYLFLVFQSFMAIIENLLTISSHFIWLFTCLARLINNLEVKIGQELSLTVLTGIMQAICHKVFRILNSLSGLQ
jgi:hypothetical protein